MAAQKAPKSPKETDVEKEADKKSPQTEENNEWIEKVKVKVPPGINASLVLLYGMFFSMFAVGLVNLQNCPLSRLIPIYLIVSGAVGALAKFISKFDNKYVFNIAVALVVFYIIWQGLGTCWVYSEYKPSTNWSEEGRECDRVTYLLAFWTLTLQYTILTFIILVSGCYMMMKGDFQKK